MHNLNLRYLALLLVISACGPAGPITQDSESALTWPPFSMRRVASYDPHFELTAGASEQRVEVRADAASVSVRLATGETFGLLRLRRTTFSASRDLARGSQVQLLAVRSDGATARTLPFRYLEETPVVEGAPAAADAGAGAMGPDASSPGADAGAPSLDAGSPTPSYDPGFRMGSNCNTWWIEVYASAASVEVELQSGERFPLALQSWGSFATSRNLPQGTSLRLSAVRSDGAQARSVFFPFLSGTPTLEGSSPAPDAGTATPADAGTTSPSTTQRLHTQGNRIHTADGQVWAGRGANLHDTRSCDACTWQVPNPGEVKRRVDLLVDGWHATFMRLTLESYAAGSGRVHWRGVLDDADYLADLKEIVDHIGTKPGAYVMVSLWISPTFSSAGWPTAATGLEWKRLAETFADSPHVLFGLSNEPEGNYNGASDAAVWAAMNQTVQVIRDVEDQRGVPHHVIAVQGTGGWARFLNYYTTHPITAGGGDNVAYEVHVYDPQSAFNDRFVQPAATLPVIIGEFGPVASAGMTLSDCSALMASAEQLQLPYLAWTFHQRCPPNLLVDNSAGGCGVGMALQPTAWGQLLKDRLAP